MVNRNSRYQAFGEIARTMYAMAMPKADHKRRSRLPSLSTNMAPQPIVARKLKICKPPLIRDWSVASVIPTPSSTSVR